MTNLTKLATRHVSPAFRAPPGPRGAPLVGSALAFRRDPLEFLSRTSRAWGDVAQFRLGLQTMILLTRPEHVESVLLANARAFRKPAFVRVMGRLIFGEALTAIDGDRWLRRRRLAAPAFHRQRVEAYGATMGEYAATPAPWADGETVAVDEWLLRLNLRILAKVLFDADIAGEAPAIGDGITSALAAYGARVQLGIPTPDALPFPHNLRMRRGMADIKRTVGAVVGERRASGADTGDLLSMLLQSRDEDDGTGMSDIELRDELVTMFAVGGHQTTLALGWALALLAESPLAACALRGEVDAVLGDRPATFADVARLPYVAAVVDETLRLYPPFYVLAREATAAGEIGGYSYEQGTVIALSPWVTQRDARWFPEPARFRPERWLDPAPRPPPFAYFPFGGGPRVCIARSLARLQMTIVLATLCARWELDSHPDHPIVPHATVAISQRHGVTMVARARARR